MFRGGTKKDDDLFSNCDVIFETEKEIALICGKNNNVGAADESCVSIMHCSSPSCFYINGKYINILLVSTVKTLAPYDFPVLEL